MLGLISKGPQRRATLRLRFRSKRSRENPLYCCSKTGLKYLDKKSYQYAMYVRGVASFFSGPWHTRSYIQPYPLKHNGRLIKSYEPPVDYSSPSGATKRRPTRSPIDRYMFYNWDCNGVIEAYIYAIMLIGLHLIFYGVPYLRRRGAMEVILFWMKCFMNDGGGLKPKSSEPRS